MCPVLTLALLPAYTRRARFFELLDMANKLFLSSLLFLFPTEMQLPAGMIWAGLFLVVLLLLKPYVRRNDGELIRNAFTAN